MHSRAVWLLVLPALLLVLAGVDTPLGGSHVFRQAHVAANIDKFVEDGISLRPSTYNLDAPFSAFDFPLYQIGVASLCRLVPVEPLRVARVTSGLLFLGALVVLWHLLPGAGIRRWPRGVTVLLFAYAPLNLFYFQVPMIDDLAVLLALLSLQRYVGDGRARPRVTGAVLLFAFLSTLIKSPVYLPVFVALLWHRVRSRGRRTLVEPGTVALVAVPALAVACFKVYWAVVNGSTEVLTAFEQRHYFGSFAERFSAVAWRPVLSDLVGYTANPVVAVLAILGALGWIVRSRGPATPLFTGLLLGSGVTLLVFFKLYPPHNYYQLPFVFPVAFFGAQGLECLRVLARAGRRHRRRWHRVARVAVPATLLATGFWGWTGFRELATSSRAVEVIQSRGEWIQAQTGPTDCVVYVHEGTVDDWNPALLYFARRDGYNLPSGGATPARVAALSREASARCFPRVLLFTVRPDVAGALAEAGAQALATDRRRTLLRVDTMSLPPSSTTVASRLSRPERPRPASAGGRSEPRGGPCDGSRPGP